MSSSPGVEKCFPKKSWRKCLGNPTVGKQQQNIGCFVWGRLCSHLVHKFLLYVSCRQEARSWVSFSGRSETFLCLLFCFCLGGRFAAAVQDCCLHGMMWWCARGQGRFKACLRASIVCGNKKKRSVACKGEEANPCISWSWWGVRCYLQPTTPVDWIAIEKIHIYIFIYIWTDLFNRR